VAAVARDEHRLLPVAAHLTGEFGEKDVCIGVPVTLGRQGVERVVEVELLPAERDAFRASVAAVRADLEILAKLPR
jgi:malate dehydrogenase